MSSKTSKYNSNRGLKPRVGVSHVKGGRKKRRVKSTSQQNTAWLTSGNKLQNIRAKTIKETIAHNERKETLKGFEIDKSTNLVVSNRVGTSGSIQDYLEYASTINNPYLISTTSHYNLLTKKNVTSEIVKRVSDSLSEANDKHFKILEERIRKEEREIFNEMVGVKKATNTNNINEFANWLNGLDKEVEQTMREIKSVEKKNNDLIVNTHWNTMYNVIYNREVSELIVEQILNNEDIVKIASGSINHKDKSFKNMEDAMNVVGELLDFIAEQDALNFNDFQTIEESLTLFASLISRTQENDGFEPSIAPSETTKLAKKFQLAWENISKLDKTTTRKPKVRHRHRAAVLGPLTEMMSVKSLQDRFEYSIETDSASNKKTINNVVSGFVSGGDTKKYGSIDLFVALKNQEKAVAFDSKYIGPSKSARGVIYQGSITANYQEALQDIFGDDSIDPSIRKLFRSFLVNRASQGYNFRHPELRELMTQYYHIQNFDRLFSAEKNATIKTSVGNKTIEGFPLIAIINLTNYPFSEIVSNFNNYAIQGKNKTFRLSGKTKVDHEELYKRKVDIGRGTSDPKRKIQGFAAKVPEIQSWVDRIESTYFKSLKVNYEITRK